MLRAFVFVTGERLAPAAVEGAADRASIRRREPFGEEVSLAHDLGTTRAVLLVTHGTLRTFFPYFEASGDTIDAVLDTALDGLDPDDRCDVVRRLGWMAVAIAHGHTFFGDLDTEAGCDADAAGYLGVVVRFVDGEPVVVQSTHADVHRGDAIVAIDGVDMGTLLEASWSWHGAATCTASISRSARCSSCTPPRCPPPRTSR